MNTTHAYTDIHAYCMCTHTHVLLILQEIKLKDRKEKKSTDSVCPREHFKDKPVDVSCSKTDETRSGTGEAKT